MDVKSKNYVAPKVGLPRFGVTARVMGTFLTWMQEKEEPVFVLAINNIDQLPPEMLQGL